MTLDAYLTSVSESGNSFAQRVGISAGTVSKLRHGLQIPRPVTMEKIERATDGRVKPHDWYRRIADKGRSNEVVPD